MGKYEITTWAQLYLWFIYCEAGPQGRHEGLSDHRFNWRRQQGLQSRVFNQLSSPPTKSTGVFQEVFPPCCPSPVQNPPAQRCQGLNTRASFAPAGTSQAHHIKLIPVQGQKACPIGKIKIVAQDCGLEASRPNLSNGLGHHWELPGHSVTGQQREKRRRTHGGFCLRTVRGQDKQQSAGVSGTAVVGCSS